MSVTNDRKTAVRLPVDPRREQRAEQKATQALRTEVEPIEPRKQEWTKRVPGAPVAPKADGFEAGGKALNNAAAADFTDPAKAAKRRDQMEQMQKLQQEMQRLQLLVTPANAIKPLK